MCHEFTSFCASVPRLLLGIAVWKAAGAHHLNVTKETNIIFSLPLLNSFSFEDLCQLVEVSEAQSYFVCLTWVINPHLSFSVRKGHLN